MTSNVKVVFLGTNGWYDTATGNTICVLIDAPEAYIVLDAGYGLYKLDRYIKDHKKPIYLFLSHFHLDHLAGLHIMAKFRFKQGIMIVGQKGTKKILAQLLRQPFTLALKDLKTKVTVREVNGGNKRFPILEAALKLKHVSSCFGFRFRLQDKVIAFVPDTGVCDNAYRLAGGADLLIAECAFAPGQKSDDWPHLNPESGAKIAKETGARRLALVHFDAEIYKTLAQRARAGKIARRIFPRTVVTRDGMVLTLK